MELVESKVGNSNQSLFDGMEPARLYYSDFGDTDNSYDNLLT